MGRATGATGGMETGSSCCASRNSLGQPVCVGAFLWGGVVVHEAAKRLQWVRVRLCIVF
jgi:hypothetical protein